MNRKKYRLLSGILTISFLIILGCQHTTHKRSVNPMKTGKISYSVEYVPKDDRTVSPLYVKLANLDLPLERTVYFDGVHSCEKEISDFYGIRLEQLKLRRKGNKASFLLAESQPHFSFWLEMEESLPVNEEKFFVKVTKMTNEKRTLLGYRCYKAIIEEEHTTRTVWYTDEISIDDPTGAVMHHDSIPGLILEMEESINGKESFMIKRTRVTSIDLEAHESHVFDVPKDAVRMKHIDEAVLKNQQTLIRKLEEEQKAHPLTEKEKQLFEGKWVLSYYKDRIVLEISKNADGNTYSIQQTIVCGNDPEEKESYQAVFYGELLFVDLAPTFLCYRIMENGDLKLEMGDFFVFKKQPA